MNTAKRILTCAIALLTVSVGTAHAVSGTATMTSRERLNVSGCGSGTDVTRVVLTLRENRTWSARTDAGNLSGDYTQKAAGRRIKASLDARSENLFSDSMAQFATEICGTRVTIDTIKFVRVKLKINKRNSAISGRVTAKGRGSSSQGGGQGKFKSKLTGGILN